MMLLPALSEDRVALSLRVQIFADYVLMMKESGVDFLVGKRQYGCLHLRTGGLRQAANDQQECRTI